MPIPPYTNEMKSRLYKLIREAEETFADTGKPVLDIEKYVADYLIDNGVIVPPCKIGDTIYFPLIFKGAIDVKVICIRPVVYENEIDILVDVDKTCKDPFYDDGRLMTQHMYGQRLGKDVYLTREEADMALNALNEEGEK